MSDEYMTKPLQEMTVSELAETISQLESERLEIEGRLGECKQFINDAFPNFLKKELVLSALYPHGTRGER